MNSIDDFERRILKQGIPLEGFIVIKDKKQIDERYYSGFNKDSLHRMYSASKSLVSLGIGKLCDEGRIALDDKICDYFPEYCDNRDIHEWTRMLTIKDMLRMATCHSKTTYKLLSDNPNWTETFFVYPPDRKPGTEFNYDTSSTQTLSALIQKLTGMNYLDYLRNVCLNEIGWSGEAYTLNDPVGIGDGGSGMFAKLSDMAKLSMLLIDNGMYEGKHLLPEWYIKEATATQISTAHKPEQDERFGYGYFFWTTRMPGYCMYGYAGQLALIFPEHNLIFVTMGNIKGSLKPLYDAFYNTIYKDFAR